MALIPIAIACALLPLVPIIAIDIGIDSELLRMLNVFTACGSIVWWQRTAMRVRRQVAFGALYGDEWQSRARWVLNRKKVEESRFKHEDHSSDCYEPQLYFQMR